MQIKTIIANLKAVQDTKEIHNWITEFKNKFSSYNTKEKQIIICPPFPYLMLFAKELKNLSNVFIGAQDVSAFEKGQYTGEVTAPMLADIVSFVLIGHSERRINRAESFEQIQQKIKLANLYQIPVILCIEKMEKYIGQIYALAYEPTAAIGTGIAEDPYNSFEKVSNIQKDLPAQKVFYGGSVNEGNVLNFSAAGFDGVLVGKASLDVGHFLGIVENS
jgi:triosephosphate isomerase (TIM)